MGGGDGACKTPEFHGNSEVPSARKKTLAEGVRVERSSLELSITGFPFRPFPPLPFPFPFHLSSLPSLLAQRHGHPHLHGEGWQLLESTAGSELPSLPRPAAAEPGGRRRGALLCPGSSSSSPCAPLQLRLGKPDGSPGRGALGDERRTEPGVCSEPRWESPGAGGGGQHRRFRRSSSEQTAPGACGAEGRVGGLEAGTCLGTASHRGPGEEGCAPGVAAVGGAPKRRPRG